jgi:hypothetical protein
VQLTTDGHKAYLEAVEGAFGADLDYAMLVKIYGESAEQKVEKRYSPAKYTGSKVEVITGNPNRKHISTQLCGAPEPHHENVYAPVYPPHQCLFKEG